MNVILVFFLVVVSTGIETPLEFLFSSLSGVGAVNGMVVVLAVVILVVEVVCCCVAGLLAVLGVVDIVEEGWLKMMAGVTLGFCVVINCLLDVVCVGISGWGLLKLFGII